MATWITLTRREVPGAPYPFRVNFDRVLYYGPAAEGGSFASYRPFDEDKYIDLCFVEECEQIDRLTGATAPPPLYTCEVCGQSWAAFHDSGSICAGCLSEGERA